jgi:peptidyl-prolyl cis-trans isomerase B (cyclophilin B)
VSSKQKQRKAAARAKYESYLERRAAKARRQRRNQIIIAVVVVFAIVGGAALWMGGVFSSDDAPSADPTPSPTATTEPQQFKKPDQVLEKGAAATLTLATNQGTIAIELETEAAPENSNSLAFLAGTGYFDGTTCHRLTTADPLFVLQCGDPTGSGSGGPGYTVADENLPKAGNNNYPAGTVAMAEPQGGDAGSQFFLVYKDTTLPPDYTIVGQITKGLDVVTAVADAGVADGATDGQPAIPITIETATFDQA